MCSSIYFAVEDNLPQLGEVVGVHCVGKACMYCIASGLVFKHTRVRRTELLLVERFAESLGGLFNFPVDLFIELREVIFNQHIGAITLFAFPADAGPPSTIGARAVLHDEVPVGTVEPDLTRAVELLREAAGKADDGADRPMRIFTTYTAIGIFIFSPN